MKKSLFGAIAGGMLALPLSAYAQPPSTGAYVDVGVGQAQYDWKNTNFTVTSEDKDPTAYKVGVGFKFTPNFGAELGYADLGKQSNGYSLNGVGFNADLQTKATYLAGTASMPLGDRDQFSIFGKLGASWNRTTGAANAGNINISDSENKTGLFAGAGAAYHFTDNIAGTVGYDYFGKTADNDSTAGMWTVGARFSF